MLDATVVVRRILARLATNHAAAAPHADPARLDVVEEADPSGTQPVASPVPATPTPAETVSSDAVIQPTPPARRLGPQARRATGRHLPRIAPSPAALVHAARSGLSRAGGPERALPIAVAVLVLAASIVSVVPAAGVTPQAAADAGAAAGFSTPGATLGPRLAIGGVDQQYENANGALVTPPQSASFEPVPVGTPPAGPFSLDATLLKPVAPDTTVADGSGLLQSYVVRQGDTLSGIASKFGLSVMTVVWSNSLTSIDLHVGQKLVIPPLNGAVIKVGDTDTLASIARDYGVSADSIVAYNHLTDPSVTIGQILVIPGGKGDPLPAATPQPQTTRSSNGGGSGNGGSSSVARSGASAPSRTTTYSGGRLLWPVPGGYMSQGYHWGHWAIDIAADTGSAILAAASGTVVFAGWKNNGGGYQVWISHGSGLYTTYNHMAFISVSAGQQVGRGQRIGGVGMTGDATGPHCHFEVWVGPVWAGGQRMNPLNYL